VAALLAADPTLATSRKRGQFGERTPLHVAAEAGRLEVARLLIDSGADVMARDEGDNATPLHWAAQNGHLEVVRLLLDRGADPNACDDVHERGPLGWAVCLHEFRPDAAQALIDAGVVPDIFAAIALEDGDAIRVLAKADPGALAARMSAFEDHRPPLHFAVDKAKPAMVELLLELGADLNAATPSGRTAIALAAQNENAELMALLEARGARRDALTLLILGEEAAAMPLIECADAATRVQALGIAASRGQLAAMQRLLELGTAADARSHGFWLRSSTPLILASYGDQPAAARLLLAHGADPRALDEYPGAAAIHYAAWNGNAELVTLLLDHGADLAAKDAMFDGDAVGWAAENGKTELIDLLIDRGADIDLPRLAYFGRLDLVRRRLESHPEELNRRGSNGTALHQAAQEGFVEIVEFLLERGADTQARNRNGETVLASVRRARIASPGTDSVHARMEGLLLQHGATD
jgi:ankyrin repeat protein